ncbi:MAG: hypothetical protein M1822_000001 [Bathelium mastoideum]|nr:MAG: hypothetical protein M1822_000001 [Bathelium mastoideum]
MVAAAQQFGSALYTRYTREPLQELIRALNNDGDIVSRRFIGKGIYDEEMGKVMTMRGEIEAMAMNKLSSSDNEEQPTQLGTLIVCLSVCLSKAELSRLLASAILIYIHGMMERSMESTVSMLEGKISKYTTAVLGRDSMCNKLENAKMHVLALMRARVPEIPIHAMFLPPRLLPEEGDFVEFLAQMMAAKADDVKIYTRSIKLLGMAALLHQYGWQIDVSVENETGLVPILASVGLLSVTFSSLQNEREFLENHKRYIRMAVKEPYSTALCPAAHMGEVTGLSFARTDADQRHYMQGYELMKIYWDHHIELRLNFSNEGRIQGRIWHKNPPKQRSIHTRACRNFLKQFTHKVLDLVSEITIAVLCNEYPSYDWNISDEAIAKQPTPHAGFTEVLYGLDGDHGKLWLTAGAAVAT